MRWNWRLAHTLIAGFAIALALALPVSADWPTNHQTNARDGNDTSANPFSAISQQWISLTLDGDIYGSPLVVGNKVIVATQNDTVYALDAASGVASWSTNVGT